MPRSLAARASARLSLRHGSSLSSGLVLLGLLAGTACAPPAPPTPGAADPGAASGAGAPAAATAAPGAVPRATAAVAVATPDEGRATPLPEGDAALVAALRRSLDAWDLPHALRAYARLRELRQAEDPELLRALSWRLLEAAVRRGADWDPGERREAVGALGRARQPATLPLLAELSSEPSWELRWTAVEAVGRTPGPEAGELLRRALSDPDRRVRCATGSLLLERDDPAGVAPALECGGNAELQYRALRALLPRAGLADGATLQRVARHQAQEPQVQLAILLGLRRRPDERFLLAQLERDNKPAVRYAARCALGIVDGGADAARALRPFRQLLEGGAAQQMQGIHLLGVLGRALPGPAAALLQTVAEVAPAELGGPVAVALGHLADPAALAPLQSLLRPELPPRVQAKAVASLARLPGAASGALLLGVLADPARPLPLRRLALAGLSGRGDAALLGPAQELAAQGGPADRLAATAALAELAEAGQQAARAPLVALLHASEPEVRAHALSGLAALGGDDLLPLLATSLLEPRGLVPYAAAAAVLRVLGVPQGEPSP